MKRYRLRIPEMIRREDCEAAQALDGVDGCNIDVVMTTDSKALIKDQDQVSWEFSKDWLEEIKDEPMSAEEWILKQPNPECIESFNHIKTGTFNIPYSHFYYILKNEKIDAFKAGVAESEKKYRLKQTFEEWHDKLYPNIDPHSKAERRIAWQAHAKATNTEA